MDDIVVRFAPSMKKGNILALIAREAGLKAEELRVLIALFIRSAAPGRSSASFADLVAATALPAERVHATLSGLLARGFIETADDASGRASGAGGAAPARRKAPGGRRLEPKIMNYDVNVEGLIRAGDAMARGARPDAAPAARPPESAALQGAGAAGWDPLAGEDSRPAAMRFLVWLRFVLSPRELEACERFAIAHGESWNEFIDRFGGAKAAGREAELLGDLRGRIGAFIGGPPETGPGAGGGPPRSH